MAEIKTTREHREAALAAWNGPNPPRVVLAVNDVIKPWLDSGSPIRDGGAMGNLTKALQRIAEAVADAEERGRDGGVFAGRAIERADVLQRLDNELADDSEGESWQLMEREDFEYLRASIARGDHVRKANGERDA